MLSIQGVDSALSRSDPGLSAAQRRRPHPATSPLLSSVVRKEVVFLNMNVNPYIQNPSTPPITSHNLLHVWPLEISLVLPPGAPSSRLSSQAFSTLPGFRACLLDEPISPELRGGRPLVWETWQVKVDGGICVACPGEAARGSELRRWGYSWDAHTRTFTPHPCPLATPDILVFLC